MPYIKRPILGRLTQGCIFTCARAELYADCQVFGFVITARCDVEQDKFPILNYVPVVHLDDWLVRDGFDILQSNLISENDSSIRALMKTAEISESVLNSQNYEQVRDAFFREPFSNKEDRKRSDTYNKLMITRDLVKDICANRKSRHRELFFINEKMSKNLVKELIKQNLSGYYFLKDIEDSGDSSGYVVMLREVKYISRDLSKKIASGYERVAVGSLPSSDQICFDHDDFAMPIGELGSPFVEHVMQSFSRLFGRIGVQDHQKDYVEKMCCMMDKWKAE